MTLQAHAGCIDHKNIPYQPAFINKADHKRNLLDVYTPKGKGKGRAVVVFIHGGNWNTGNKNLYTFFGKNLARKGTIAVIINYRLSPGADYAEMSMDCARAFKWVYENIELYGGDKDNITVSGHSAGGHLAALIANDQEFFDSLHMKNPIKKCLLIDAFGLNMYTYFPKNHYKTDASYKKTFTNSPKIWMKASPVYYVNTATVPHLIFLGGKTFPAINQQEREYQSALEKAGVKSELYLVPKKKHVGMILQFYWKRNKNFKPILEFMKS